MTHPIEAKPHNDRNKLIIQMQKEWINIKEAMALLDITSRTTMYKYLLRFNIRTSKLIGKVYINRPDILQAIEGKAVLMGA